VKRLKLRRRILLLVEYDLLQWRRHESAIAARSASLPKRPRVTNVEALATWRKLAQEKLAQPVPLPRPVRVWELGSLTALRFIPGSRESENL
jgi:hypothetical protein